jgi:hypothetical protein
VLGRPEGLPFDEEKSSECEVAIEETESRRVCRGRRD